MDTFVRELPQSKHFRGNIVAVRDGHIILEKSYGLAVEGWDIPNTSRTKFEIASLSKQFTAAAILQLVDAGKLRADDPVSKFTMTRLATGRGSQSPSFNSHVRHPK